MAPHSSQATELYVADAADIYKYTPPTYDGVFASNVYNPNGLATDVNGNVYECDNYEGTVGSGVSSVYKFTPTGQKSTVATGFFNPTGIALDKSANVYFADDGNGSSTAGTIYKVSASGTQSTFASGLNQPQGLACDASGNLYEADFGSSTIFKFSPTGAKSVFASVSRPVGLAFNTSGYLYVASGNSILKYTLAGAPAGAFTTNVSAPEYVAVDSAGNVYVSSDVGFANNSVYMFSPSGTRTTLGSNFTRPQGVAVFPPVYPSGNPTPTPTPTATPINSRLINISTRVDVLTGNEVAIGGFIIHGAGNKQVLVRALGPTLAKYGVTGVLPDPVLTLHHTDAQGHDTILATNDNWQVPNGAAIQATGKAPPNPLESAILMSLAPGNYTAIATGKGTQTGVGLVEVYDLDQSPATTLANISTRGFVSTGNNVMIGGFVGGGSGSTKVIVRALGPTLSQ
ncbi:MAG: NHL repeat-containing protein, partial [Verrucomicrobia bacterium]|nr:NHL repeat-containing protein [Verrucomicrobiota bacterium]